MLTILLKSFLQKSSFQLNGVFREANERQNLGFQNEISSG
jgi:hypothetical protein